MMTDSLALSPPTDTLMAQGNREMRVANTMSRLASLKDDAYRAQKIDETAQEFEAVFISQMLQHMFAGLEVNELFGGGHGEEMFQSLLVDEYGKVMAKAGGIGLADHVRQEMLNLQEIK